MANTGKSYDTNTVSRFRNAIAKAVREQKILPKILVIVPDDDLIKFMLRNGISTSKPMERILCWLMSQIDRILSTHKEFLPIKSKRPKEPMIIWVAPPYNVNFHDNILRQAFCKALERCAVSHDGTHTLQLKKIWNENETTLFLREDKKYTSRGYKTYWYTVDKAIKYANTLLLKKEERKRKPMPETESDRSHHHFHNHDRFHWNREPRHDRRQ